MNKTFEQELNDTGWLLYTNVGTSMLPLIRQGKDAFIIQKKGEERCKKYDAVLYKSGERYILHRIIRVTEKGYVIRGDNCYASEYGITDSDILGVMTEVIRKGKSVSVSNPLYKMYVHIWCALFPIRSVLIRARRLLGRLKRKLLKIIKNGGQENET